MTILSNRNYTSLNRFSCMIIYIFLARFTSLKIDDAVVCLLFDVNMVLFGDLNVDEFNSVQCVFSFMCRMRCYELKILLSSPSGTVLL